MNRYKRNFQDPNWTSFFELLEERQSIWYKKEIIKLPRPWTENELFDKYKFCNVYRELDRVSRYLILNIVLPYSSNPKEQVKRILLLRHTNSPKTYEIVSSPASDLEKKEKLLDLQRNPDKTKGEYLVSDALMFVPGQGFERVDWILHFWKCVQSNIDEIYSLISTMTSPGKIVEIISARLPRFGNFLSYEIYCDLCYTEWFHYTENDFTVAGPGATWGLELLTGESSFPDYERVILDLAPKVRQELIRRGKFIWILDEFQYGKKELMKFSARNMEHCLCEYRKMFNLRKGEGRKRKYEPTSI